MDAFRFDEKYLSQIPTLQVLVNLGYRYLTPVKALTARGGKAGNVLLEEILREQLTMRKPRHYRSATRGTDRRAPSATRSHQIMTRRRG